MTKRESERYGFVISRLRESDTDAAIIPELSRLHRLASTYHRMSENDCNGEGVVNGRFYRCDNDKAYINKETGLTVFGAKMEKIEKLITSIVSNVSKNWTVNFQGDPRGWEIEIKTDKGLDISCLLYY